MQGPKEKRERALGVRLGLKGERSMSPKSAVMRKPYKPGVHGPRGRQRALSEFGLQIREKSKFKLAYGVDDRYLGRIFGEARRAAGANGAKMVELLERRLDNVVFRLGFAPTRGASRQLVRHGHIAVNGKKVASPGYVLKVGDKVTAREGRAAKVLFTKQKEFLGKYDAPAWLRLDPEKLEGEMLGLPANVEMPFEINLLVESFSK